MKTKARELAELRMRLADAEETLRAIRAGEVDAVVVAGKQGPQVFTLEGAEHAYRVLIECMNEGALILTANGVILYANESFAKMVKRPLKQVMGLSFHHFLSAAKQAVLRPLLKRTVKAGFHIQALLHTGAGSELPARISSCPLPKNGGKTTTFGIVVTDMTEAQRNEELLRAISSHQMDAQETERGRVAVELHENISQITYAILMRCHALAMELPADAQTSRAELLKLRDLLSETTEKVRHIAGDLRPSALDNLGLLPVLRMACNQFGERTHVRLNLEGVRRIPRLPAAVETALYRILQEVLKNIEKHARARHVTVCLRPQGDFIQLAIRDDGSGFDPNSYLAQRKGKRGLGLLSMRERATYLGGTFKVKSGRRAGTEIEVCIPLSSGTLAANGTDL